MIRVENIKKTFNPHSSARNQVLKGVSFDLPDKGLVAIFGKSGSGKTTLLRHLKSVLAPHGKLMLPKRILSTPPNTYMNKGLTPNDSKNRLHFLYPFTSIIQMRSARKLEASPQVVSTKVGDHIFLLIGHP